MNSISLSPPWKNVAAKIIEGAYTYGDLIPYEEFFRLLDMPEPSSTATAAEYKEWGFRRMQQMSELRRCMLQEHNMMLDTQDGVGILIIPPGEQTARAESKGRNEIHRAMRDMRMRLTCINTALLTAEQRRENTDAQIRLAMRTQALRGSDRADLKALRKEPSGDK